MKKRSTRRYSDTRQAAQSAKPDTQVATPPSEVDRWSNRAASWAQVATLVLVTFGYFYTVLPVYQKELLEEQSARLQIEKANIERDNKAALVATEFLQKDLAELKDKRTALALENARLLTAQGSLGKQLTSLKSKSVGLTQKLDVISELNEAQEKQIVEGQRAILPDAAGMSWMAHVFNNDDVMVFLGADQDKIKKWEKAEPIQPIKVVLAAIDLALTSKTYFGLPEPHRVSEQLILELRSNVVAHTEQLTCPSIDRSKWRSAWLEAQRTYKATIPNCVNMHVAHTAKKNGWTEAQTAVWREGKQGKQYRDSFESACASTHDYYANRLFSDAWEKIDGPCTKRLIYAVSIANGEKNDLEPFPNTDPPTPDKNWFSGWYKDE